MYERHSALTYTNQVPPRCYTWAYKEQIIHHGDMLTLICNKFSSILQIVSEVYIYLHERQYTIICFLNCTQHNLTYLAKK